MVFTNHETRDTNHGFYGRTKNRNPTPGPPRPPASRCFPVHHCSLLFTNVRHCSAKNIAPQAVSTLGDGNHGLPVSPGGEAKCLRLTRHVTRPLWPIGSPGVRKCPATRNRRPDRRARRPLMTSLRMLTGPFLDIPGFLPRENGFLPPDNDFLPNHNESKTRYFPQFPTIPHNSSEFVGPPRAGVRAPLAAAPAASGLLPLPRTQNEAMPGKGNVLDCVDRVTFWLTTNSIGRMIKTVV